MPNNLRRFIRFHLNIAAALVPGWMVATGLASMKSKILDFGPSVDLMASGLTAVLTLWLIYIPIRAYFGWNYGRLAFDH